MFLGRGNVVVIGVDIVNVRSERNYVVVEIRAVRSSGEVVGFELILVVDRAVVRLGFHLVIGLVEHGRLRPIAVEREERHVEVDALFLGGYELDKAFHEHAVREQRVDILSVAVGQLVRYVYFCGLAALDGDDAVLIAAVGHRRAEPAAEHVTFFRNVFGVGRRHRFGHADKRQLIRHGRIGNVDHVEAHIVNARAFGVVFEFELRPVYAVHREVRLGVNHVVKAGKPRALLARRVRVTLLVEHDCSRGHEHLVSQNDYLLLRVVGEFFLQELTDKHYDTAKIGRRHGRAAQLVVVVVGHGRFDFAAVRRDFRL